MPTDPNANVVRKLDDVKKELHDLVAVLKKGFGFTPTHPFLPGVSPVPNNQSVFLAEEVPVRFDWTSPDLRGKASIVKTAQGIFVNIDIDREDLVRFEESLSLLGPLENLLISSMTIQKGS